MKAISLIGCTLLLLVSNLAVAYVPDYKMIMSRLAENHGRGIYQFYQDVVCPSDPEPYVIREIWTVQSENSLRVTLAGRGQLKGLVEGALVYSNGQRYFKGENGKLKVSKPGRDWTEPFFHFRFSKNIKPLVYSLGMAPEESLSPRKVSKDKGGNITYENQDYMRLSRVNGRVAYAIGTPVAINETDQLPPGLWVEQDRFHVLKVRMPSGSTVDADSYQKYSGSLYFPSVRKYTFGETNCEVQLEKAVARSNKRPYAKILNPKSLVEDEKQKSFTLPEIQMLREFYARFR